MKTLLRGSRRRLHHRDSCIAPPPPFCLRISPLLALFAFTLSVGAMLTFLVQPMVAREGHELIVGSTLDPQFGPVLLFGRGGQLVEIEDDAG